MPLISYVCLCTPAAELAQPVSKADFETINVEVNGKAQGTNWRPLAMKLITTSGNGRPLKPSDSPWLGSHALIMKPQAVEAMRTLLGPQAEFLKTRCDGCELFLLNPTHVVDALDEQRSVVRRFSTDNRVWKIEKYVFKPAMLEGLDVFKIPNLRVSPTFVSDRFVQQWKDSRLKGLKFIQVWPD